MSREQLWLIVSGLLDIAATGLIVGSALRRGIAPSADGDGIRQVARTENPSRFWLLVWFYLGLGAAILVVLVYRFFRPGH
jgi:hypothetical protein